MTILEKIHSRTVDDAGCWVWRGAKCNGHPCMRVGSKTLLVRRLAYEATVGEIPAGKIVRMTCATPGCVNPEHIEATTYRRVAVECGKAGLMSGAVRSAKIAATKRAGKQAKLTDDAVRDIRSSGDTLEALAARHGIHFGYASKVRRGDAWRDFTNPFLSLIGASK